MKTIASVFYLSLLLSLHLSAQIDTTNWTGNEDIDWHTPGNWDNGVPDASKVAILNLGTVEISNNATAAAITISNGSLAILLSTLTIDPDNSSVNSSDGIRLTSPNAMLTIESTGALVISNTADDAITIRAGQLINQGQITIDDCTYGIFDDDASAGSLMNSGKIYISDITIEAILFRFGTFANEFCGFISSDNGLTAGGLVNNGTILYTSNENSTINLNNASGIIHNLGTGTFTMTNNGILDTNPAANYWRGCDNQVWSNGCNWSRDRDPMKADSVIISPGDGDFPELSSMSDTVMHVLITDSLVIQNGGKLIVDGTPATTFSIGIRNRQYLMIEAGGSIHTMHTSSDGVNSIAEFINDGDILVEDATFASVQANGTSSTFVNNGSVTVNSPGQRGIQTAFGGQTTNNGEIHILAADQGIWHRDADVIFTNNGLIEITNCSANGILFSDAASGTSPTMTNAACAVITTDEIINIDPNSSMTNHGLINYTAAAPVLSGTYTDDGYQYDPNSLLLDGGSTTVIDAPRSKDFFNTDLDGDGMTFCQGDTDDVPTLITCGQSLIGETNAGGVNNLDDYPCAFNTFNGPEHIYAFDVVAPDTLVIVTQSNRSTLTDLVILTDPADPLSCIQMSASSVVRVLSPGRYYIAIDGFGGNVGTYDIQLSCIEPQDTPVVITCGETLTDQDNLGNLLLNGYSCNSVDFSGPERLYRFEVNEPDTLVSVMLSNASFSYRFFLLSDPEDPLSCIASRVSGVPGAAATLSPGTYYIAVEGAANNVENFDITLNCVTPQDAPVPITCGQTLTDQDNLGNSLLDGYNCTTSDYSGPERLYSFEVATPDTLVSIALTNESSSIAIFLLSDLEDPSSCIATGSSEVATYLSPGTYYVAIDGFESRVGTFDIGLRCSDGSEPGLLCASAIDVICGQSIDGSLSDAFIDPQNDDGCDLDKKGLWYKFTGTGDTVVVSLCNTAVSFDSELAVLTGTCGNLTCNGTQNDQFCGGLSEVTLATALGETYWVHVTHFNGLEGDFTLTITCQDDAGCISQRLESGNLDQSVYTASQKIISDGSIASPNMIRFSAPEVELLPEFEVSDGQLEVDQEGCP